MSVDSPNNSKMLIRIDKSFPYRIIIPAPQIVKSGLLIIHIPTISEWIQRTNRRCQTDGFADRITPRIITIFYHLRTIRVNQRNHIALQIVDIEVIDIVIGDHAGLPLRIPPFCRFSSCQNFPTLL